MEINAQRKIGALWQWDKDNTRLEKNLGRLNIHCDQNTSRYQYHRIPDFSLHFISNLINIFNKKCKNVF